MENEERVDTHNYNFDFLEVEKQGKEEEKNKFEKLEL
jgi:hypothetical protein